MIELIKLNDLLYAKVLIDLRLPIEYQTKQFGKGKQEILLLPDEVMYILTCNGNIRIWNGEKYIKLNLGQFYGVIENKNYKLVNYVEPKKEEKPKVVEQPKEEKIEEPEVVKEEIKVQPEVKEEPKQQNENKKQRHNKQQNQGGDK